MSCKLKPIILALLVFAWTSTIYMCVVSDIRVRVQSNGKGYVLNLGYMGQQASAEHGLVLQQCWLGALHMSMHVVEPFLIHTTYQGYPPCQANTSEALSFSDLHDLESYNNVSRSRGFVQLATWREFLNNAPRRCIFVEFTDSEHSTTKCAEWYGYCCKLTRSERTEFLFQESFCIVRIVELSGKHPLSLYNKTMLDLIFGFWKPEEVTLVFNTWKQSNGATKSPLCEKIFRKQAMSALMLPNKQLLSEATSYQDKYLGGVAQLTVMIRAERIIEQSAEGGHAVIAMQKKAERKAHLDGCFATLIKKVHELQTTRKPFVTTDIGKFASTSWRRILSELNYSSEEKEHVFSLTKRAVATLSNDTLNKWEETFKASTPSRFWNSPGYIATLQRTIASMGECLVLFGGGNFQEVTLSAYIQNHPSRSSRCVRIVCASRELRRNLMTILRA